MKKILIATVLLFTFSLTYAQFNFGIRAGYNSSLSLSNISSVTDGTYNLNSVQNEIWNNFHAGVFARVFMKKLYIEPAILYSMEKKNFKISATNVSSNINDYVDIKTVDVPILVGLKLLDLKVANLRVFAGPKLRFDAGSTPSIENVESFIGDVKKANLGLECGAGVDVLFLALDFHYNLISNMYDTKLSTVKFDPADTFVISLSWKLF